MDYITYIDSILEFKAESYKKIETFELKIENKPYVLSKKAGEDSYIGESEGKEFLIQIIESTNDTLPIYEIELKKRESVIEIVSGIKKSIHIVAGNIVIINELGRRVSLLDYLNYRSFTRIPLTLKENSKLCLDIIIKALQEIIRCIASTEKKNMSINSLGLQDVYVEITQNPIYPIFTIENYGIEIKIDPVGQTPFLQKYSVMTGLALCLFSALKEKPCENIDFYYSKIEEKMDKYLKIYPYPIYDLIKLLLKENIKAEEILFSKTFGT